MDTHTLCRGRLKLARLEAKANSVDLEYVCSSKLSDGEYAVFYNNDKFEYAEYSACCAFDARAQHIETIVGGES